MDDVAGLPLGSRRNEDIALDLMKFIAITSNYGKTSTTAAGFSGTSGNKAAEDHATHLLELYGRCLTAVQGKK
jgi:hypothetical protein